MDDRIAPVLSAFIVGLVVLLLVWLMVGTATPEPFIEQDYDRGAMP